MDVPMTPLEKAIAACGGSPSVLAGRVGETPQTINNWRKRGVPAEKCRSVEAAVFGAVTAAELRPDVFGEPGAAPSAEKVA
jgi:DNA-binding transcriptional regulator YdaS (Cro superfamily)